MSKIKEMSEDTSIIGAIAFTLVADCMLFLLGGFILVDCLFRAEHGVLSTFYAGVNVVFTMLVITLMVNITISSIMVVYYKIKDFVKSVKEELEESEG